MLYAGDHDGKIPYGPKAGASNSAGNFYPSTGAPTSLVSLQDGRPVGLGLLLAVYLARTPQVLFCPGNDDHRIADEELARVGKKQAQGGYYYRHGGNTALYDDPIAPVPEPPLLLGALGTNRRGEPIRALVIDTNFRSPPQLKSFGVDPVTNHHRRVANVLYSDGHVSLHANDDDRYTVHIRDPSQVRSAFSKILTTLEMADAEP